jgi:hypothetical protein
MCLAFMHSGPYMGLEGFANISIPFAMVFYFLLFFFMNKKNFIENQHNGKLPLIRDGKKPR